MALIVLLILPVVSYAQPQILQGTVDVTGTTITSCGSSSITLTTNSTATSFTWYTQKLSSSPGSGSLSPTNGTGSTQTFTPTISGVDAYTITLSDGTDSSTVILVFGPTPDIAALNIPSSLCENGGFQQITNTLSSTQTLSASTGVLGISGTTVALNPQGLANNTSITIRLQETYNIPGSTLTFDCENTTQVTVYSASQASFSLGQSTFQKCENPYTLPSGSPAGGSYTVNGFPNAINAQGQLDPSALPEGTYQLTYTAVDANGCTTSTSQNFSITGLNYTGSTADILVFSTGSPFGSGPPLNPSLYNGVYSFSECVTAATTVFSLYFANHSLNFQTYSFDWDDGTTSSGTVPNSTTNPTPITHLYNAAGIYNVSLTLTDTINSCSISTNFILFFGSQPALGFVYSGDNTFCLEPGDSAVVKTMITNWENDIAGTVYTFSSNDGTSFTATAPLTTNGISNYPFITTNSSGDSIWYRHVFYSSSCGAISTLTGDNAYEIQCSKSNLCATANGLVDPIVISSSPEALLYQDTTICTDTYVVIEDRSFNGQLIKSYPSTITQYTCDSSTAGVWEIYDEQWNLIPSTSSLVSLAAGSTTGDFGFFNANKFAPWNWNLGSKNLEISFSSVGTYHLIKYIGTTENSNISGSPTFNQPYCRIDQDTVDICVDTIPVVEVADYFPDFVCLNSIVNTSVFADSVNCFDSSSYRFSIYDSNYTLVTQSPLNTDTTFSWTATSSGLHYIEYVALNDCGNDTVLDTFYVIGASFYSESSSCAPWTTYPLPDTISNLLSFSWSITPNGSFTSLATITGANTSNPTLSFSDLQYPNADQDYTLTLTMVGPDGCTVSSSQILTLYARPNADFTVPADACGPVTLSPNAGTDYGSNGTINAWNWSVTDGGTFSQTSDQQNPSFALPASTNGVIIYTVQQIVTDDRGCIDTLQQTFSVFPTPTASFTLSDSICTGASINPLISNNSSANDGTSNLDYYWTIDTAGTLLHSDSSTVPTYTLVNNTTSNITYFVSLTVTNQYGCDSTITDSIVVLPNAIAQLDTTSLTDCAPFTIDSSIVNAVHYTGNGSYTWSVLTTDSNFVTSFNGINALNYTISNDDTSFIIRLVVSSLHNCLNDTAFVTVTTIGNPNPYWSLVDSAGCAPFTPVIDSLTADAALTHTWIIYDSTGTAVHTLNGNNPTWPALNNNSYTNNNSYNIKHIVQAGTGCKDSASITVTVWPTPLASFQSDTVAACAPWTPLISNNSQGNGLTFVWSLDTTVHTSFSATNDSTPNLSFSDIQWPQGDQQYNLTLSVTSDKGCTDDTTQAISLHARPKAGFILPQDSCGVFLLQPQDTSKTNGSITDWLWTLTGPNGSTSSSLNNPTFNLPQSFNGIQNYTLRLQVTNNNGCIDTLQQNFTVFPTPTASFTLSDSICTGASINPLISNNSSANDGTSNLDYYWTIDTAGTLLHSDSSTVPTYTLVNNTTSNITYFVSLTVTNQYGCDSTITDSIVVLPNAIAQLDTTSLTDCAPFTIDSSIVNAVHYTGNGSYTWSVLTTDSNFVTSFNGINALNYTISNDDTSFIIRLVVSSLHNCLNDTAFVTVTTIGNPNPYWSLVDSAGCAPFTPVIDSLTADAALTHTWIIYDSTGTAVHTLNGNNPTWPALNNNSYTNNNSYNIKHIVQAGTGCKDSASITVTVWPTPLASFQSDTVAACAPWTPLISNNSQGNGLTFVWSLDTTVHTSFSATNDSTPNLSFSDIQWPQGDQQYNLTLSVTSDKGCTDDTTQAISLHARPKAGFILPQDSCGVFLLQPQDTSKTNGSITDWLWTLTGPNGSTSSSLNNPTFNLPQSFNGIQNYTLRLQVTNNNGCIDTLQQNFTVFPTPTASFTLSDSICTGASINPLISNNSSANDGTSNLDYYWTIDTAGTLLHSDSSTVPTYTLVNNTTSNITYFVSLTVTNQYGCDSTITDSIVVLPNAIAQLDTTSLTDCAPFTIDSSIVNAVHYTGNGSYTWSVLTTDSNFVTSFNGINALNYTISNDDTSFIIRLVVSSLHNCLNDTAFVTVTTIGNPNPYWSLVDSAGCAPFTPVIDSLTADAALTHTWIIYDSTGTAVHTLNGNNPTWPALNNNSYTNNNSYNIKHIVQAGTGCKDSASITVTVWPTPLASFQSDTVAACAPWTPLISNNSQGNGLTFVWSLDTTVHTSFSATNDSTPNLSFSDIQWPQGDQQYNLTLSVTSDKGCTDDTTQAISLHARPKAGFILPQDSCGVFLLQPQDTSKTNGSITDWLWTLTGPNGSTSSSLNNPTFNLPQSFNGIQNYTLRLQVTNNNGCIDTLQQNFTVFPTPTASFTLSDSILYRSKYQPSYKQQLLSERRYF